MRNTLYMLADLSDADMIWLLSAGRLRRCKPGERAIEAGRAVSDLFFVVMGTLAVVLPGGQRVATLTIGDVMGDMSFVEMRPPAASVQAVDKAQLLAIPRKTILKRFEEDPLFAARFYRGIAVCLSERLRDATSAERHPTEREEAAAHDIARVAGDRFQRLVELLESKAE